VNDYEFNYIRLGDCRDKHRLIFSHCPNFRQQILKFIIDTALQICQNIRQVRVLKGYSQQEIADKMEVTRSTYRNWEENTEPDLATIRTIASVLGVPAYTLLKGIIEFKEDPEKFSLNDSGEGEYKKAGPSQNPADLLTLIQNARLNLEIAEKVATSFVSSQTNKGRDRQQAVLGKKRGDINPRKKNEPKDNVSKKGN
jgi:transcriptional regulator with XRE-family HTH domain